MLYLLFKPKWAAKIEADLHALKGMARYIMAKVDEVLSVLTDVSGELDGLDTDVDQMIQKIDDLNNNTPPEVDLTPILDAANAIKTRLGSVKEKADTATPDELPADPNA
jgi:uncharacterized protein YoxC